MEEAEEWRPVKDFEGLYEVSNLGRVRSLGRDDIDSIGRSYYFESRIMRLLDVDGYLGVKLCNKNNIKCKRVHRLVAEAFLENPLNYEEVNHLDLTRDNNYVSNLEWCTSRQNCTHRVKYSGKELPVGITFHSGKFRATFNVKNDVYYLGSFETQEEAENIYNITLNNYLEQGILPKKGVERKRRGKYKGVQYYKKINKYLCRCMISRSIYTSTVFATEEEAYEHLCKVKEYHKLHGKFPPKT